MLAREVLPRPLSTALSSSRLQVPGPGATQATCPSSMSSETHRMDTHTGRCPGRW